MAEVIVTAGSEPAPNLDRYGRPCPIAAALQRFNEHGIPAVDEARGLDSYRLVHTVASGMDELINRMETIGAALEALVPLLAGSTDSDQARALVDMAIPYRIDVANRAFDLCAQMLAALERSGMLAVVGAAGQREAAHV